MVRQGVATLAPLHGGAQQPPPVGPTVGCAALWRSCYPSSPYRGASTGGGGGLLLADVTFGHCSGCNLHPCGKAAAVVDQGQAIAPAVITACAPGGLRVEVA